MQDKSEVTFVNDVAVTGFANGILNVAFLTYRHVPGVDDAGNPAVVGNQYISANLRMDLYCVQQLHDAIGQVLKRETKPAPSKTEVN